MQMCEVGQEAQTVLREEAEILGGEDIDLRGGAGRQRSEASAKVAEGVST